MHALTRTQTDEGTDDANLRAKLSRVVARACPPWAAAYEEDIVQAAMMRVLRVRTREGNRLLPASYLWKVAYSATIDEIRRLRSKREVPLAPEDQEPQDLSETTPEQRAHADEIIEGVRQSLSELAEDRRRAVTLYLQGHTVPEVGRLLGWSAKRAENLVYRGLSDLRQRLAKKGLRP